MPSDTPDHSLRDTTEISAFLADSINRLRRGQLDPRVATAMGYLAGMLLKSIEIEKADQRPAHPSAAANLELNPTIDIYQPLWLREREQELRDAVKKRYLMPRPTPENDQLTEADAIVYLQFAGGDKERARKMAGLDGWKF